jgi:hypothetical protein
MFMCVFLVLSRTTQREGVRCCIAAFGCKRQHIRGSEGQVDIDAVVADAIAPAAGGALQSDAG